MTNTITPWKHHLLTWANGTYCDELTLDAGNLVLPIMEYRLPPREIVITESGTYSVTVTNPATGCTATDNIGYHRVFTNRQLYLYSCWSNCQLHQHLHRWCQLQLELW